MSKIETIVKELKLEPLLGEGGMWATAYRTDKTLQYGTINDKDINHHSFSSIYYAMTEKTFSHMHVLNTDELWFYHDGQPVEMLFIYPDHHSEVLILGPNIEKGEHPQILCRRGTYQGSHMQGQGEYSLVSCVNVPCYSDEDYAIGTYEKLRPLLSNKDHESLLKKLTGEIGF